MKYIDVVDERIKVLSSIKDNWYKDEDFPNGIGKSFSKEGLEWFRKFWLKYFEDKTDMEPYIYPTVDGEIQIEWNTFNRVADSQLVINPETKIGDAITRAWSGFSGVINRKWENLFNSHWSM